MTEGMSGNGDYIIRPATIDGIEGLIELRLVMFTAMGFDNEALASAIGPMCDYFERHLPTGAFRVWVAEDNDKKLIAGIGLVIHSIPPSPKNLIGKEAYIMNLVTIPTYQYQGVARRLLSHVLEVVRSEGIPKASLHATSDGRQLYGSLGFTILEDSPEMILKLKP
jgi:ribosomal protein S18 acetylase RimI-like enzyme